MTHTKIWNFILTQRDIFYPILIYPCNFFQKLRAGHQASDPKYMLFKNHMNENSQTDSAMLR